MLVKQQTALLSEAAVLGEADIPGLAVAEAHLAPAACPPQVDASSYALVENRAVHSSSVLHLQPSTARKTYYNLPAEQMHAPIIGGKPGPHPWRAVKPLSRRPRGQAERICCMPRRSAACRSED